MKVLIDENGYVTSYALVGELQSGEEVAEPEDMASFAEHFSSYRIRDGNLELDSDRLSSESTESVKAELRARREVECFPIINRGQLWYDTLTDSQVQELKTWYTAWLDVTDTEQVPERPVWLK